MLKPRFKLHNSQTLPIESSTLNRLKPRFKLHNSQTKLENDMNIK